MLHAYGGVSAVVCQLESSGKWPEELEPLRKLKVAFYVHISKALKEQKHLISSPTEHYLDILKVIVGLAPSIRRYCLMGQQQLMPTSLLM